MLIIFLFSLFYQVDIITGAGKITANDLKLPPMHADYENVKFNKPEFNEKNIFISDTSWNPTVPKSPKIKVFTDLLDNFPAARCPNPKCSKLIPLYDFLNKPHRCPICNFDLPTPKDPKRKKKKRETPVGDTDGDGIPDQIENQWGTDPNKNDANIDSDGDGFTNIYEFNYDKDKMHGGKASIHPPLWHRLFVRDIRRTLLDIRLKKITVTGADKDDWDVQVNTQGGRKSKFMIIGDTIKVNKKLYKLVDIKSIKKNTKIKSVTVDIDVSEITLKSVSGDDTIVAVRNEDVYSSKPQAILVDEFDGKEYVVDQGSILTIGSPRTGQEKYKVVKVDPGKDEVILTNLKKLTGLVKNSKCRVTKTPLIPKIQKEVQSNPEDMGPEGMPIDPGLAPSGRMQRNNRTGRIRPGINSRRGAPGAPLI